jgi:hypothetical protein
VGSFSILPIGTYAASTNFHQLRDTTAGQNVMVNEAIGKPKDGSTRRTARSIKFTL